MESSLPLPLLTQEEWKHASRDFHTDVPNGQELETTRGERGLSHTDVPYSNELSEMHSWMHFKVPMLSGGGQTKEEHRL